MPQAVLTVKHLKGNKHSAYTTWGGDKPPDITLDEYRVGLIRGAVHECLHIFMSDWLGERLNATLDEVVVQALEDYLCKKNVMGPNDAERWRRKIEDARRA